MCGKKEELEKAGIYIETLYGPYGGYVYNHKKSYDIEFNYNDIDNIENILNKLSIKEQNDISITLEKIKTIVIYSADDRCLSICERFITKKGFYFIK